MEALTPGNAALLLIDHQVGLLQLVRDASPEEFRNNVLGLAKTAKLFELPVILTTSLDWGPNGPILPELKALFPDVATIRRPGVINAWRWPAFRDAVDALNRTKLIIAAMTDSTCLQFPALDAVLEGFDVHGVSRSIVRLMPHSTNCAGGWKNNDAAQIPAPTPNPVR